MEAIRRVFTMFFISLTLSTFLPAQQAAESNTVPQLMNFSGRATDVLGRPLVGMQGMTFAIYQEQSGGSPLWLETQNVQPDAKGNYAVQLGAATSGGIPQSLFSSGEARWLGVRINGGEEQSRLMLLSVPYAMKAGDATTVGGLPASAFVLAAPPASGGATSAGATSSASPSATPAVGGSGTTDFIPIWTDSTGDLGNSVMFQSGTGSTAKVGINSTTPATTLDVNGTETVRGLLTLPATGTATAIAGRNSQAERITASSYNSTTKAAVNQNFQWQAEPTGNNTTSPAGTFNLLFGSGTATPAETGLHVARNGQITFAAGQTFPGTGGGSVTSVGLSAPGSDFNVSGSPVTTSGTLGLNWTIAPTNADTASAIVKRDANGAFSAGEITASATIDDHPAVTGTSTNIFGTGVLGAAPSGSSSAGTGVAGQGWIGVSGTGSNVGVSGTSSVSTGVQGIGAVVGVSGGGSNYGVSGSATGTGSTAVGVYGSSASSTNSIGVYGAAPVTGVYGVSGSPSGLRGTPAGVWGDSTNSSPGVNGIGSVAGAVLGTMNNSTPTSWTPSSGVYGSVTFSGGAFSGFGVAGSAVAPSQFATCCYYFNVSAGVWGDSGYDSGSDNNFGGEGVLATSDNNPALVAYNNSPPPLSWPPILSTNYGGGSLLYLQGKGSCHIDGEANVACSGSNAAVVPVSEDREVSLYAVEAPENWFEDFGSGQLVNGAATVSLEPIFAETVNLKLDYHVFLTPNGDCKGLYVEQKRPSSFEVRELGGGTSSVAFDYRIVARRLGYESKRLVDVHPRFQQLRMGSQHKTRAAADASPANARLTRH